MTLVPCRGCGRHVRAESPHCPFCDEAVPSATAPTAPLAGGRLSRAAVLAGLAVVAGCNPSRMPHGGMTGTEGNGFTNETTKPDTTAAGSASVKPAEAPPIDAGPADATGPKLAVEPDAGGPQLAVEPDAGGPQPGEPDAGAGSPGDKVIVKERKKKVLDNIGPPDWEDRRQRRRNCDRCPYGAPPPPAGRVIV